MCYDERRLFMSKKIVAILLVVAMLAVMLASCGSKDDPGKTDDTKAAESETKSDETLSEDEIEAQKITDYVKNLAGEYDFDGETFGYIGGDAPKEEEETGELIDDSLYYRMRDIEDLFGVDFQNITKEDDEDTLADVVLREVMAGGDTYDLVYGSLIATGKELLVQGALLDTYNLQQLDFSNEWWAPELENDYGISGALYFLAGSMIKAYFEDPCCILFNKAVAENFNISSADLYQTVTDNKWTFDKMTEIASVISVNTDGNGVYRYANGVGLAFVYSSGMDLLKSDDNGDPYVEAALPRELSDLADKVSAIWGDDSQTAAQRARNNSGAEDIESKYGYSSFNNMFADDVILFYNTNTGEASALREEDVEFGILPMPMYYSNQTRYYSYADDWNARIAVVPKSVGNYDKVGTIIEALAALSEKYLRPACYEKVLKGRSVYDVESRDMIDLIYATKKYDLINVFADGSYSAYGAYVAMIDESVDEDSSNLASGYVINAKLLTMNIKRVVQSINK